MPPTGLSVLCSEGALSSAALPFLHVTGPQGPRYLLVMKEAVAFFLYSLIYKVSHILTFPMLIFHCGFG